MYPVVNGTFKSEQLRDLPVRIYLCDPGAGILFEDFFAALVVVNFRLQVDLSDLQKMIY